MRSVSAFRKRDLGPGAPAARRSDGPALLLAAALLAALTATVS
ncbi:hypothetical protein [Streptomyces sp. 7N604]